MKQTICSCVIMLLTITANNVIIKSTIPITEAEIEDDTCPPTHFDKRPEEQIDQYKYVAKRRLAHSANDNGPALAQYHMSLIDKGYGRHYYAP